MNSSDSRDLPIPAGPKTVTRCGRRSATTRSQTPVKTSSWRVRPTIGTRVSGRSPAGTPARTAIQAVHGLGLPLCLDGLETGLVLDHVAGADVRVLADENCADRRCASEGARRC